MEKYEAIYKCINDKLEEYEMHLEYYREESMKKEKRILELEEENAMLKAIINDLNKDKETQI